METERARRGYGTDLTDEQWRCIAPWLRRRDGPGRPPRLDRRAVVNGLFYQARTGCPWRLLPTEFPAWQTVRYYFDRWTLDGTLEALNNVLVEQARQQRGRQAQPTAGILDTQSVKTTEAGGERGWAGGKG
jgi:putative transposase